MIFVFLASPKFSAYLDDSFDWPLNATTVRIASNTSSAIEPALAYASNSFFDNWDVIYIQLNSFYLCSCKKRIKNFLFTNATIPMTTNVTGIEVIQINASSHPLTNAKIIDATNETKKCTNMTTFSPNPSSSFVRSL